MTHPDDESGWDKWERAWERAKAADSARFVDLLWCMAGGALLAYWLLR